MKNLKLVVFIVLALFINSCEDTASDPTEVDLTPFIIYSKLDLVDWHIHRGIYKIDLISATDSLIYQEGFYSSISSDNRYLYFRETYYSSNIMRLDIFDSTVIQLTQDPHVFNVPRFSSDGSKMVWNEGGSNYDVYTANYDGTDSIFQSNLFGYTTFQPSSNQTLLNRGILFANNSVVDTLISIPIDDWGVYQNEYSFDGKYIVALAQTPPYDQAGANRIDTKIFLYNLESDLLIDLTPEIINGDFIGWVDFVQTKSGPMVVYTSPSQIGMLSIDGSVHDILKTANSTDDFKFAFIAGSH